MKSNRHRPIIWVYVYDFSRVNQIKFPLWEFEFILTCRLLASEEKTLYMSYLANTALASPPS